MDKTALVVAVSATQHVACMWPRVWLCRLIAVQRARLARAEAANLRIRPLAPQTALNESRRLHAGPPLAADDDMVVDGHAHVTPSLDQILRQANVLLAGRGVAAGMIVDDDDGGSAERDGAGDHFADMDRGFVDAARPQGL